MPRALRGPQLSPPLVEALRAQGFRVYESLRITPDQTPDLEEIRQVTIRGAVLLSLNYAEARQWMRWADQVVDEGVGHVLSHPQRPLAHACSFAHDWLCAICKNCPHRKSR